ncbi:MAG: penicillin-binding protein [Thermobacillus sp. ZCTH02-B1]|uniref:beta-lactamase family protein n=1 Tax=Thermobacillus sp. ZCTH02-B1 TaxID=1858795 RepID=UPI000B57568E|nr:beta-lactamase family protein [Thermobacillus sp. ZCTH02-B1]OUM94188.1 MAG: penicillin-binding protein [Thermobacillus sp. ZCTH02-B1]
MQSRQTAAFRIPGVPMRFARALLLAAAFLMALPLQAFAADREGAGEAGTPLTPETAAAFLEEFFELAKPYYTGAAVVIVKDGEVIAQEGIGYADEEKGIAVDPAGTLFHIASVSKTFTAVAIMQLAEQGKIDLDGDIRHYLPGIEIENPFARPVTVADLLAHRSGFEAREPEDADLNADFDGYARQMEDYAKRRMPPVVREPGSAYMYDNFAYLLLGLIVQNASGEPFGEYMRRHVFEPLGMNDSTFLPEPDRLERLATYYHSITGEPLERYVLSPAIMPYGGMLSTAEDIGRFMIAFLNEGLAPDGARVLSAESVAAMSEYRGSIHPLLPDATYGFEAPGQLPMAGSSGAVLAKLGDLPGSSSMLLLLPEEETGVFLVYNRNGVLRDLFHAQFMAKFFPEYAVPADLAAFAEEPAVDLKALEGLYTDLRQPAIAYRIEAGDDGVLTVSDALLGTRTFRQAGGNLFVDETLQRFAAFRIDADGTVYMRETAINPLGYQRKADAPAGYADVGGDHPYAPFILGIQSLGYYPNEAGLRFEPERPVTRAELVWHLLAISGLGGSDADTYAFSDIAGHPLAPYIQAAAEFNLVHGTGGGRFEPDRPVTRQEAAIMVYNGLRRSVPEPAFADVQVEGNTAPWARHAVRMIVGLGLHGPEVALSDSGVPIFNGAEWLTRQEEAALLYKLLLTPVQQIAEELMQRPPSETVPGAGADAGRQGE